jgi:hypothetical protein
MSTVACPREVTASEVSGTLRPSRLELAAIAGSTFQQQLISTLKRWGFRYVLVDSEHVDAVTPMRWEELHYRPPHRTVRGEEQDGAHRRIS